jgi:mono/diheme cytochrome c family protein
MRQPPAKALAVPAAALLAAAWVAGLSPGDAWAQAIDADGLYAEHCAACHGADRLGGQGPALLPQNLRRLKRDKAARAIAEGLPATQMPGFAAALDAAEIGALVKLMYTPLAAVPQWGVEEILASRVVDEGAAALPAKPVFAADPLNLFVVVESGDHHVTILDGDRFRPLHRFKSRFALHGGPKFSADGRFVYFASRDGWVTKYDLYNLAVVAEARAGINSRNLALAGDGRYVAVANYLPHTLVILDARDLRPLEVIPVEGGRGSARSTTPVPGAASLPP